MQSSAGLNSSVNDNLRKIFFLEVNLIKLKDNYTNSFSSFKNQIGKLSQTVCGIDTKSKLTSSGNGFSYGVRPDDDINRIIILDEAIQSFKADLTELQ